MKQSQQGNHHAVLTYALITYCLALVVFALAPLLPPPNPLFLIEIVIAVVAGLSAVFLLAHSVWPGMRWWTRWSYLAAGSAGLLALLAFSTVEAAPFYVRLVFSLFILSGSMAGFGAHLAFGGGEGWADAAPRRPRR